MSGSAGDDLSLSADPDPDDHELDEGAGLLGEATPAGGGGGVHPSSSPIPHPGVLSGDALRVDLAVTSALIGEAIRQVGEGSTQLPGRDRLNRRVRAFACLITLPPAVSRLRGRLLILRSLPIVMYCVTAWRMQACRPAGLLVS